MKFNLFFVKSLIVLGRLCGITFGGITVSVAVDDVNKQTKNSTKLRNKKCLRIFENFAIVLTVVVSTAEMTLKWQPKREEARIVIILGLLSQFFMLVEMFVFLTTMKKHGKIILEYLINVKISKNQFFNVVGVFGIAFVYGCVVMGCETGYVYAKGLNKCNETNLNFVQFEYCARWLPFLQPFYFYFYLSKVVVSTFILAILSFVCFWKLQFLKRNFLRKTAEFKRQNAPRNNKTLEYFCKEYIRVKQEFDMINSKLSLSILVRFICSTCFTLLNAYKASNSQTSFVRIFQFLLDLIQPIAFCFVHGLPHDYCKELHCLLDYTLTEQNKIDLIYAKILTKDTVGFTLLGVSFDQTLIGPVSNFICF